MPKTLELAQDFKKRYPATVSWRLKRHSRLIDNNLHRNEEVFYAFGAQWNHKFDMFDTAVFAITNERMIVAQQRVITGYQVISIDPRLFNDIKIDGKIFWGSLKIDTVKEIIDFSNISKKSLFEIKKVITSYVGSKKRAKPELEEDLRVLQNEKR